MVVLRRPGVMDPVEASVHHALADAGLPSEAIEVRTATRFRFAGRNYLMTQFLVINMFPIVLLIVIAVMIAVETSA